MWETGVSNCSFSVDRLGLTEKVIFYYFWKRCVSQVEYLGKELSVRGESQFKGLKVRLWGKSRNGRETIEAGE